MENNYHIEELENVKDVLARNGIHSQAKGYATIARAVREKRQLISSVALPLFVNMQRDSAIDIRKVSHDVIRNSKLQVVMQGCSNYCRKLILSHLENIKGGCSDESYLDAIDIDICLHGEVYNPTFIVNITNEVNAIDKAILKDVLTKIKVNTFRKGRAFLTEEFIYEYMDAVKDIPLSVGDDLEFMLRASSSRIIVDPRQLSNEQIDKVVKLIDVISPIDTDNGAIR